VSEHAADHRACNRAGNVDVVAALLDDLLPLDPATPRRRSEHRADRGHGHDVEAIARRSTNAYTGAATGAVSGAIPGHVDVVVPGVLHEVDALAAAL
jgi:hypothetical protein